MGKAKNKSLAHKHKAVLAGVALAVFLLFVVSIIVLAVTKSGEEDSVEPMQQQSQDLDRVAIDNPPSDRRILDEEPDLDELESGVEGGSQVTTIVSELNSEGNLEESITSLAEIVDDQSKPTSQRQEALDALALVCFNSSDSECLNGLANNLDNSVLNTDDLTQKISELNDLDSLDPTVEE